MTCRKNKLSLVQPIPIKRSGPIWHICLYGVLRIFLVAHKTQPSPNCSIRVGSEPKLRLVLGALSSSASVARKKKGSPLLTPRRRRCCSFVLSSAPLTTRARLAQAPTDARHRLPSRIPPVLSVMDGLSKSIGGDGPNVTAGSHPAGGSQAAAGGGATQRTQ